MGDTAISWTHRPGTRGRTWNPVRGCSRTIAKGARQSGCGDGTGGGCYAERTAGRFCGPGKPYDGLVRITAKGPRWTGVVRLITEHLGDPLRWREPSTIFVNSMSDLFHEELTNEQIAAVFGIAAACPQHIFQCLTKRAQRLPEWHKWLDVEARRIAVADPESPWWRALVCIIAASKALGRVTDVEFNADGSLKVRGKKDIISGASGATWPLQNWWQGVSVENQEAADERLPYLNSTPAAVRFLSCEPLIGPVVIPVHDQSMGPSHSPIDWVISGAESGPGARPALQTWFESLAGQCRAAGVAYFVKQIVVDGKLRKDVSEFPVDLQIQEFPR